MIVAILLLVLSFVLAELLRPPVTIVPGDMEPVPVEPPKERYEGESLDKKNPYR